MRTSLSIVLALVACGTDVRTDPDEQDMQGGDDPGVLPDAGAIADATPVPPDGIPPGLTPCEEAVYHSDLAWIQRAIFDVSCTNRCHGDTPPSGGLSLRPGESRAAMVNVASRGFPSWIRVVPGNPGASMLMVQVGGEPGPELEGFMPWGQPMLCREMIDAMRRWIAEGAQP